MKRPVDSQHLNTHIDAGDHPSLGKPINLQVPLTNLSNRVMFTCAGVLSLIEGACGPHLSQMEVTVSGQVTPVSNIHRACVLCPTPATT